MHVNATPDRPRAIVTHEMVKDSHGFDWASTVLGATTS